MNIKRIILRYQNHSSVLKATFWFTVCNFIQRGMSIITAPIFTRIMPTDEFGTYSTYSAWENVLFMIISLSLYKSLMNLYVRYDDYKRVLSSICGIELLITGICLVFGIVFRDKIGVLLGLPVPMVCCLLINFVSQAAFQAWSIYKRYIYDYKMLILATLVMFVGSSIISIMTVVFISHTAFARVISISVVTAVVAIVIYISVFNSGKVFFDKSIWFFAIGFSAPLLPAYLSEFVLQSSDKLMINYLCGAGDVALYSVAYAVGSIINLFTNSISATFSPYLYQKMQLKEYEKLPARANQVLLLIGVILTGIMLFSKEIVLIFGGYKYIESTKIIIPICLGVFFNYLFSFFGQIQQFYERKRYIIVPAILCSILNLVLNYIFIKVVGYQAAAYTTFFSYALFCFIHYFLYRKVCREALGGRDLYDVRGILAISIGLTVAGMMVSFLNHIIWIKYSILLLGVLLGFIKRVEIIKLIKNVMSK